MTERLQTEYVSKTSFETQISKYHAEIGYMVELLTTQSDKFKAEQAKSEKLLAEIGYLTKLFIDQAAKIGDQALISTELKEVVTLFHELMTKKQTEEDTPEQEFTPL